MGTYPITFIRSKGSFQMQEVSYLALLHGNHRGFMNSKVFDVLCPFVELDFNSLSWFIESLSFFTNSSLYIYQLRLGVFYFDIKKATRLLIPCIGIISGCAIDKNSCGYSNSFRGNLKF